MSQFGTINSSDLFGARVARLAISSPKMSKAGAMGTLLAIKINFRRFFRFGDNAGDLGKSRKLCKFPLITIFFRTQNTYRNPEFDGLVGLPMERPRGSNQRC